eukprot:GHVT01044045.1.p1 GENE.GHVT01044045.1~~GHVT01044045.1.p1  ORF type:complete len:141 (+),score=11.37 GHVT01044045.1:307-729(+)
MSRGGRNHPRLGGADWQARYPGRSDCGNWRAPEASRLTNPAGVEKIDAYWVNARGLKENLQDIEAIALKNIRREIAHPILQDLPRPQNLQKIIEAKNPIATTTANKTREGKKRIAYDWAAPVQEQIWKMLVCRQSTASTH